MDHKNTPTDTPSSSAVDGKASETRSERLQWSKPEIVSLAPLSDAAGISYQPGDGLSNRSY